MTDLLLLERISLVLPGNAALLLPHEIRIITDIFNGRALFYLIYGLCCAVKKHSVMGNQHHRFRISADISLQPFHRIHIQMIGGFIQKKYIRLAKEQFDQCQFRLFPSGKFPDFFLELLRMKPKLSKNRFHLGLIFIAAQLFKLLLHPAVFFQDFLRTFRLHPPFQCLKFLLQGMNGGKARLELLTDAAFSVPKYRLL